MSDDKTPQADDPQMALARALWRTTRSTPEGETDEARKAAWKAEKAEAKKVGNYWVEVS